MAIQPGKVVIYHNPKCSTSRKVLGMLREAGVEAERRRISEDAAEPGGMLDLLRRMEMRRARCCAGAARHMTRSAWRIRQER